MLNKAEFLEQLIRQRLVYNKAVDEKVLKNQDLDAMIQMAKEAIVLQFYIREKFKNEIAISPQEVEEIFTKQKERFKGVPGDQAEMFIRQQVFQQKLQMKAGELLQNLRDQSGVKKNLEPLKIKEAKPEVRMEVKPEVKPEDKAKK
jgi:hypothetical protein